MLTSDDPYVTVITTRRRLFGDLAGGARPGRADHFVFLVAPGCPHGRDPPLRARRHSAGSDLALARRHPGGLGRARVQRLSLVSDAGPNGLLDPGETASSRSRSSNDGGMSAADDRTSPCSPAASTSTCRCIPAPIRRSLRQATARTPPQPFTVHAASGLLPRVHGPPEDWSCSSSGGMRDTVLVSPHRSARGRATDPTGPDGYGYYAYDNTDVRLSARRHLYLDRDRSRPTAAPAPRSCSATTATTRTRRRQVTLPFTFKYYGQSYTTATICSNGWIVMGIDLSRPTTATGPSPARAGPTASSPSSGTTSTRSSSAVKCYQRYDAANHAGSWSGAASLQRQLQLATETFEAIFYDPAYYPTETGDGMIVFQYPAVNNVDGDRRILPRSGSRSRTTPTPSSTPTSISTRPDRPPSQPDVPSGSCPPART